MNLTHWRNNELYLSKLRDGGAKNTQEEQSKSNKMYDNLMKKNQYRRTMTSFK